MHFFSSNASSIYARAYDTISFQMLRPVIQVTQDAYLYHRCVTLPQQPAASSRLVVGDFDGGSDDGYPQQQLNQAGEFGHGRRV
jgi:hypothetical protein